MNYSEMMYGFVFLLYFVLAVVMVGFMIYR